MIPYGRQDISQSDIDAIIEVLRSDYLTQGPTVERFENSVAQYCQSRYSVAVNSATSALHIACLALDLGVDDWLWTSPNTFVASANCALYCGAKVDFVDIDPRTYNMSVECLGEKLEHAEKMGRLPKVVVPVHFAGQPCDMRSIFALSQRYGFKVVEDASHAIGASYMDRIESNTVSHINPSNLDTTMRPPEIKVGSCIHSHISVFSFHPVKIITSGEGGMALTNDPKLASRMRILRSHGTTTSKELMRHRPDEEIWNYQQIELGFNYRMTDIQAALGLSQMQRLDEFIRCRHAAAKRYDTRLDSLPLIKPYQAPGTYSSYHLYPIRVSGSKCGSSQRQLYNALWERGVAANLHYIPVHRQPYFEDKGFKAGDFPEAECFHREMISIPIFSKLSEKQQESVIRTLGCYFGL